MKIFFHVADFEFAFSLLLKCLLISSIINSMLFHSFVKGSLEQLTNKLRSLNGDIKDPRAAFMNRTKVQ